MHDKAVCRFAKEKDGAQVQALWTQCFDDTSAFVEWYFQRYYQKENTLGIFAGDTLLASAQRFRIQSLCGGRRCRRRILWVWIPCLRPETRAVPADCCWNACGHKGNEGKVSAY